MRPEPAAVWISIFLIVYLWFNVTGTRDEALAAVGVALVVTLFVARLEHITQSWPHATFSGRVRCAVRPSTLRQQLGLWPLMMRVGRSKARLHFVRTRRTFGTLPSISSIRRRKRS